MDYNQTFDSSYKINFLLYEDTPTSSNATHAVYRAELGLYSLTSSAKVRYLACSTSIFSDTFNIIVTTMNPGTLQVPPTAGYNYSFTLSTSLSLSGGFDYMIWLSSIQAWKTSSVNVHSFVVNFQNNPNRIEIANSGSTPMYFGTIKISLIFVGNTSTISGTYYKLPYTKNF